MRTPPSGQISLYSNGRCDVLAIAVSELTGGQIRAVVSTVRELGDSDDADLDLDTLVLLHCWVLTPEGVAIDANGRHDEADLVEEWAQSNEVQSFNAQQLQDCFGSFPGPLDQARRFVVKYSDFYLCTVSAKEA